MIDEREGRDTDRGQGSGATDEETRFARPGETGTTRFGQTEGPDTDELPTGASAADADGTETQDDSSGGSGNALSSGLQPGGMIPGGGAGATVGSIGTGGGSNANEATGDSDENMIDEDVR